MELNDTIKLMNSTDYRDRFKAECYQARIRYEKLGEMLKKYEKNELNFKPKCSYTLSELIKIKTYCFSCKIRF